MGHGNCKRCPAKHVITRRVQIGSEVTHVCYDCANAIHVYAKNPDLHLTTKGGAYYLGKAQIEALLMRGHSIPKNQDMNEVLKDVIDDLTTDGTVKI